MNTVHEKQNKKTTKAAHSYTNLAAERLENIVTDLATTVRTGVTPIKTDIMGKTDPMFLLEMAMSYVKKCTINADTPEKNKQLRRLRSKALFLEKTKEHGGLYTSAEAAKELGKSKVTVKTRKDNHKMLALKIDGEFYYPVFQFVQDPEISNDGILKGIEELLPLLKDFSDRMQYSFFMSTRNTVLDGVYPKGRCFTVAELLKENPDTTIMEELKRLARLYGTQDAA
ncbi:hypothetical protein [Xenorhabdus sp. TH1]|uniref:hypothetical protein n=1 Tax=Xenorhabdus sp. TH1 TaxID=3130166 RepID=UPI0030D544C1